MAKARDDTRVEAWQEGSGNLALAGRELDPADAIAADRRITAIARALHAAGAPRQPGPAPRRRVHRPAGRPRPRHPPRPDPPGPQPGRGTPPSGTRAGTPAGPGGAGRTQRPAGHRRADPAGSPGAGRGSFAALAGSVHITLPASTWLGLADLPGEAAGLGPLDAWTSRDLAARLAAAGPRPAGASP